MASRRRAMRREPVGSRASFSAPVAIPGSAGAGNDAGSNGGMSLIGKTASSVFTASESQNECFRGVCLPVDVPHPPVHLLNQSSECATFG